MVLPLLISCQTAPKSEKTVVGTEGSAEGQWRGKAMVRNLKNGKNGLLDLDIIAREPSQLRMEITGPFGVHVASLALNGEQVNYILPREKRFVTGPADADAMTRLVPVRIPPAALLAILFDRELPAKEWTCDHDAATGLAVACKHKDDGIVVGWLERSGRNRRLKIAAPEAEVELVVDEAKSKVKMGPNTFTLSAPDGYKKERL